MPFTNSIYNHALKHFSHISSNNKNHKLLMSENGYKLLTIIYSYH